MLQEKLNRLDTSLDYKVESVLPGVHTRLNTISADISRVGDNLSGQIMNLATNVEQQLADTNRLDNLVEGWLTEISRRLVQQGGQTVSPRFSETRHQVETLGAFPSPDDENNMHSRVRAEGAEEGSTTPAIPESCKQYALQLRHQNLASMWDEWHGLRAFLNKPIVGGIAKAEELWKAKWRRHFKPREKKHFTRLRGVVAALMKVDDWDELETIFAGPCKASLSLMDDYLKANGMLTKRKPRGKNTSE